MVSQLVFPQEFVWGAATSAPQIEGACRADGRGESIWDRFASVPGNIADGTTLETACDHYQRWPEDLELMKWLGLGAYRFSVAWPRVVPDGKGPVNPAGLDFYDRLIDGLLDVGITPFPTLYHWDLPQALQDVGGWAARDTVERFLDYTAPVMDRLGDRVKHWVTHNEPWCIAVLGHEEGCHAPGLKDPATALAVAHHLLLSHGRAAPLIRELAPGAEVGIVLVHCPGHPFSSDEGDRDAARWFDGFFNRWFTEPLFRGRYPQDAVADRVARGHLPAGGLPFVREGDMETIQAPLDFLGLNYYSRNVMKMNDAGRPEAVKMAPAEDLTDMGWEVYPEGLYETLTHVHETYAPPKIFITENGCAYDVPADDDGKIDDRRRIEYLEAHFAAAARALDAGVPLAGYFVWSLLDNFEWALGHAKRFGLIGVDYATQARTPKESAHWYRDLLRKGGRE